MIDKHIEIVRTLNAGQSSMGLKSCLMIQAALSRYYRRVGITIVNNEHDLEQLVALRPDLAFLGLKRIRTATPDNDIWISAYLAGHGINYTGSDQSAIVLDLNKDLAKQVVRAADLPTAQYFMAEPGEYVAAAYLPLSFPLFIKPPTQGGGKGIGPDSIARNFRQFSQKIGQIYEQFGTAALVETYLEGREFSVALLGDGEELVALPIELIADRDDMGDRILGIGIKSADTERIMGVTAGPVRVELVRLAKAVYRELGARDYGRIDFRMDAHGQLHFLEANLVPGLAQHDFTSYFTHACLLNKNLGYEAMILKIVGIGLARADAEQPACAEGHDYYAPSFGGLSPAEL